MKKITLVIALACSLSLFAEQKNGIVYVKPGATGSGSSWFDAMGDIQGAITAAKADNLLRKDVWVAAGEYSISTCITLVDSVNVYGSFAGNETAVGDRAKVANGKAWEFVNATVLKGVSSRLFQVNGPLDMETTIDGFILTDGNGKGSVTDGSGGAALIRPNVVMQNCIVKNSASAAAGGGVMMNAGGTLRYCLIKSNSQTTGANGGGGIFCNTSSSGFTGYIENCEITENTSTIRGAGIGIQGSTNTYISNCKIFNNKAILDATLKPGAGIYANSAFNQVQNCLIYNNTGGTAVYYAGGNFYNNIIVKNIGGVYISAAANVVNMINNIVWGCVTDATGATATSITGVANATATVQNNAAYNPIPADKNWILADNLQLSSNVSNGDVPDAAPGTVGSGPKFIHVTRFCGASTNGDELLQLDSVNWSINSASPCLNAGKAVATVTKDFAGLVRPQGYPVATARYDIGAYELPYYNVVAGEPTGAHGDIYSSIGDELPENFTYGYAKGSQLELMIIPDNGYKIERAYFTESTDGGTTFTGAETDFTSQITTDGLWTTNVNASFKVTVVWKSLTALPSLEAGNVKCFVSDKGLELSGLTAGDKVSVYHVNGTLAYRVQAVANTINIPLAKGVYVLRVADSAQKLIVK